MRPAGACTAQDRSAQHMLGGRIAMRLTVLCELGAGHTAAHQSTFPDGTVWRWGGCSAIVRNEQCALLDGHDGQHITQPMIVADQKRVELEARQHAEQLVRAGTVDDDGLTEIEASAKCQCGHRRDDHHRSWASCMEHDPAGKWCACDEYRPAAVLTCDTSQLERCPTCLRYCNPTTHVCKGDHPWTNERNK